MPDTPEKAANNGDRLENVAALKGWMEAGIKPVEAWRIGTEHEKIGFRKADLSPLPYAGAKGIRAMLEGLMRFGWQGKFEGDILIALTRSAEQGGGSITLEPAGQLELSGAPLENLHQTCAEIGKHLQEVASIAEELEQGYMGIGFSPLWGLDDAAQMPKARYELMNRYMPTRGQRGQEMMYLSATVQVNLDFGSEADMVEKLRIALALQPVATALFANSPFKNGRLSGHVSERSLAWLDTDGDRTGMLPQAFAAGFGFEQYVDYALDVPMYFVIRDGAYIDALGMSFRDFLAGKLPALPNEKPTPRDWENHLTTLFPEARVKRFIEMRGADSGMRPSLCALPALWVGLLYDAATQKQTADWIADWTQAERDFLRQQTPVQGLKTPFRDGTVLDLARQMLTLAQAGLVARARLDEDGDDEVKFLAYVEEVVSSGQSPAENLIEKFNTRWNGNVRPAFQELAF